MAALKILFEREGIAADYDRFLRVYRANGLQVRVRRRRKVAYVRAMQFRRWQGLMNTDRLDFMHDRLAHGRAVRTLNTVDDFTRECPALRVGHSFGSADVIRELESIAYERGAKDRAF